MINEVVPADPYQDFYGQYDADYLKTTIPLFQKAGYNVSSIKDILDLGVYITNAVKIPKTEYTIPREVIEANLLFLEKEIALFPNVRVIMPGANILIEKSKFQMASEDIQTMMKIIY